MDSKTFEIQNWFFPRGAPSNQIYINASDHTHLLLRTKLKQNEIANTKISFKINKKVKLN